jgi:ketosteroid isomerase-like protein
MADENAEIARRMCEAAWRRPEPDVETLAELGHPEHEMYTVQSLLEGGGYRGAAGFREWLRSWAEMFGEDWQCRVEAAHSIDAEQVLITGWMDARGAAGGVPVEQRFWVLMRVRDGRATRSEVHTDHARVLRAAGLHEG